MLVSTGHFKYWCWESTSAAIDSQGKPTHIVKRSLIRLVLCLHAASLQNLITRLGYGVGSIVH
jgi:hypothetical protein